VTAMPHRGAIVRCGLAVGGLPDRLYRSLDAWLGSWRRTIRKAATPQLAVFRFCISAAPRTTSSGWSRSPIPRCNRGDPAWLSLN
jgi:hypothetical protein